MTKTTSRLRELSAARLVLHDAREEHAPRRRIWALQRQFFDALRALDVATPKRQSVLVRVDVHVQHPDRRVERLHQKRLHERDILRHEPRLDPRSHRFRLLVEHWCREFDEREGLFAAMQREVYNVLVDRRQVPFTDEGIALVRAGIHRALRERGYWPEEVEVTFERDALNRTLRFHASVPSGIEHVRLHGSIAI